MNAFMNQQLAGAGETFAAVTAFVRFLFCMRSNVNLMRIVCGESLGTLGARIRAEKWRKQIAIKMVDSIRTFGKSPTVLQYENGYAPLDCRFRQTICRSGHIDTVFHRCDSAHAISRCPFDGNVDRSTGICIFSLWCATRCVAGAWRAVEIEICSCRESICMAYLPARVSTRGRHAPIRLEIRQNNIHIGFAWASLKYLRITERTKITDLSNSRSSPFQKFRITFWILCTRRDSSMHGFKMPF